MHKYLSIIQFDGYKDRDMHVKLEVRRDPPLVGRMFLR